MGAACSFSEEKPHLQLLQTEDLAVLYLHGSGELLDIEQVVLLSEFYTYCTS